MKSIYNYSSQFQNYGATTVLRQIGWITYLAFTTMKNRLITECPKVSNCCISNDNSMLHDHTPYI